MESSICSISDMRERSSKLRNCEMMFFLFTPRILCFLFPNVVPIARSVQFNPCLCSSFLSCHTVSELSIFLFYPNYEKDQTRIVLEWSWNKLKEVPVTFMTGSPVLNFVMIFQRKVHLHSKCCFFARVSDNFSKINLTFDSPFEFLSLREQILIYLQK